MKKGFKEVIAWQHEGRTAIGVLCDKFTKNEISIAVNYYMDSNIEEGDVWYMDSIYKDEGTEIRLAKKVEIQALIGALEYWGESYKYDKKTHKIRVYFAYPTLWMQVKRWFKEKFNI